MVSLVFLADVKKELYKVMGKAIADRKIAYETYLISSVRLATIKEIKEIVKNRSDYYTEMFAIDSGDKNSQLKYKELNSLLIKLDLLKEND